MTREEIEVALASLSPALLARARALVTSGGVLALWTRGDALFGEVQGSRPGPLDVSAAIVDGRIEALCPCLAAKPCPHVAAALLRARDEPPVRRREPEALAARLRAIDPEILLDALDARAAEDDRFRLWLEAEIARLTSDDEEDDDALVAYVRDLLVARRATFTASRPWDRDPDVFELRSFLVSFSVAPGSVDAGRTLRRATALAALIVDEALLVQGAADDDLLEIVDDAADALLAAAVDPRLDEAALGTALAAIEARLPLLADYGYDRRFEMALRAIRVALGEDATGWTGPLVEPRVMTLMRVGRSAEAVALASGTGAHALAARALVGAGRVDEAHALALETMEDAASITDLAQAIGEASGLRPALALAQAFLDRHDASAEADPSRVNARLWSFVSEAARRLGDADLAGRAALAAFWGAPSSASLKAARAAAGQDWHRVREEALRRLLATGCPERIEVLIEEEWIDEAVAMARSGAHPRTAVVRLAGLVSRTHPDFAIVVCAREIERIVEEKRSRSYVEIGALLQVSRDAHAASGRSEAFRSYIEDLAERCRRRVALRPIIAAFRGGDL